jgi:hypothetical protein
MPPPASGLPARLVLGPALRAQSDGRLVRLVREGHESAFDEIVRRYQRPLDRFAASLVGGRSEDVTQDSFRKAPVALRRGGSGSSTSGSSGDPSPSLDATVSSDDDPHSGGGSGSSAESEISP